MSNYNPEATFLFRMSVIGFPLALILGSFRNPEIRFLGRSIPLIMLCLAFLVGLKLAIPALIRKFKQGI